MAHVGIAVHKNQRQICLFTAADEVLHPRIRPHRKGAPMVRFSRILLSILLAASPLLAHAGEIVPPENLVTDGIPPFPLHSRRRLAATRSSAPPRCSTGTRRTVISSSLRASPTRHRCTTYGSPAGLAHN
jgi:hypothetical protein